MSNAGSSKPTSRGDESRVVFEEVTGQAPQGSTALAFVNSTGPSVKNARVQRSIRTFVMRDHGKARRRIDKGKGTEKAAVIKPATEGPKLTVVAGADPEYFSSVQLVKAAKASRCVISGCMNMQTPTMQSPTQESLPLYCKEHLQVLVSGSNREPGISRFSAGRLDPFIPYPIEMTPRVRQLVDHVFTDAPNRNIKFYRDTIFPTALVGGITFHQVLANLALYLRHARPLQGAEEYELREELAHQARVFQIVNEKIVKKEATSDDVICAVAALACQSHVARDMRMFQMHMNGLKAIITLRGGIQTLDKNDIVRHSLYWLDVNGNSTEDTPPSWPIPLTLVPFRPALPANILLPPTASQISTTWRTLHPHHTPFLDIFDDTARFGLHLAAESLRTAGHIYTDVVFAGTLIIGLVHRLLSVCDAVNIDTDTNSDANPASSIFKEATRLALLLFLAEVRRRFGLHPADSRVHVRKLQVVLANDTADWAVLGPLRLWVLGMGMLEATEESVQGWFVGEWARRAFHEGVTTAQQAESLFEGVMWIETVHGILFREMQGRFFGRGPVLAPKPYLAGSRLV